MAATCIFIEENSIYQLDCTAAVWASDQIHAEFHAAGTLLSDADFAVETKEFLYLIEYKNANIPNAVNPNAFKPGESKSVDKVARKFYDSLHYLKIIGKEKPVKYVYIVEYPHAGSTERRMLRNKITERLPFHLQRGKSKKIIEDFDVVSIDEWNQHHEYSLFPLLQISMEANT